VLFKERFGDGIVDGSITLTFRAWTRPQARVGSRQRFGRYGGDRTASGFLEIDAVDLVPLSSVTVAEARRAGFGSREELIEELRASSRTPLRASSKVYRVSFRHVLATDERAQLAATARLSSEDVRGVIERLGGMDERRGKPWTRQTLALISKRPGTSASVLAKTIGMERLEFKANVRKLKALGLTISLETGYRLSPRGQALLRRLASP
jgi:hypothetical protein